MKIKRKLLLSYLIIVVLFIAAGAAITYNTNKMAELQNTVKQQVEINNNAYAFQQGLDQKQFGTLMYSSDNTVQGEQIIVASADTMQPAQDYLLSALSSNPELLAKFNEVVSIDNDTINNAIAQVYQIYMGDSSTKYEQIWDQLTILMNSVAQADQKLSEVRAATLTNVENATAEAQNYANLSLMLAVAFLAVITATAVALSVWMGNRITNPLKKLAEIAHKVSMGDLNQRFYLKQDADNKNGDEIDELENAFKRMINAFRMTEALSSEPTSEGTPQQ
jgi:nitrogen fixation/metabolism regulation signal transduction histidine kinase